MNPNRWLLLAGLALIWGSSFILIKRGLVGLTPYQLGALRMVCAGSFLLAIGFRSLPKIPSEKWKYIALTAFCGSFFPAFLFALAQTQISSSVSSVLNALTPLNTLVIGILAFSIDFKRNQIVGVAVGFAGSLLLILGGNGANTNSNWFAMLAVLASVLYATNVNLLKRHLSDVSPMAISAGNFTVLLLPALTVLGFSGFFDRIQIASVQESAVYVAILGVVGTGVANLLFFRLIQQSSPVFAASVTYLIPVVAFGWGILDAESLSLWQCLGAAVVLGGVYLSSKK